MLAGILLAVLMLFGAQGSIASASTLQEIHIKQENKQKELTQLNTKVSRSLEEVNVLNDELNALEEEVSNKTKEITQTEEEIVVQEKLLEERIEQAKARLLTIQKTELNQTVVTSILEAESVSDLINRAYVLMTLQGASNEQLDVAFVEQEKLTALQDRLVEEKTTLVEKTAEASSKKGALDKQVASLQKLIRDNQAELAQLNQEREAEESRIAEQKRKAQEAAVAAAKQKKAVDKKEAVNKNDAQAPNNSVVASAKSDKKPTSSKKKVEASKPAPSKKPAAPQTGNGRTLTVSATGYSTQQPGLSTHTATGIDLRVNPRVIAVDPRVIPLGSMVDVPGHGIFIAGDTGGAIKGNIIDIHFTTVGQALQWGRRTVTIKVLN